MDRFIEVDFYTIHKAVKHLKSSMDRFIVEYIFNAKSAITFKIQYG